MFAFIGGLLRVAWSFVAPTLGPVITKFAPWLAPFVSAIAWRRIARGVAIASLLGAVGLSVWWLSRPDPYALRMVSVPEVEAQRFKAEAAALKKAIADAKETIRQREKESDLADQYIKALEAEKEALRAQSSDPHSAVFAADDPWLLQRRR
jgi:hypothetical protein